MTISYVYRDDHVFRVSNWTRGGKSYSSESLVGPQRTAHIQVQPDTVSWQRNESIRATLSFTHWDQDAREFVPYYPDAEKLQGIKFEVRLQGRRTAFANPAPVPPFLMWENISEGSFTLSFIRILMEHLSAPPTPGTLFELSTAMPEYANIPAVIAVI
jgi:hypothetical protein